MWNILRYHRGTLYFLLITFGARQSQKINEHNNAGRAFSSISVIRGLNFVVVFPHLFPFPHVIALFWLLKEYFTMLVVRLIYSPQYKKTNKKLA